MLKCVKYIGFMTVKNSPNLHRISHRNAKHRSYDPLHGPKIGNEKHLKQIFENAKKPANQPVTSKWPNQ